MIIVGYFVLIGLGLFFLIQLIRAIIWNFTAGGGKTAASIEYDRLKREDPENSQIANFTKEEFTVLYIKKNGPSFWLYLGLLIAMSFVGPALLSALALKSIGGF